MHYTVTIRTHLPRSALEHRLSPLTTAGPFAVRDLAHVGGGSWVFTLQPIRPGMAIGFAKVAELLVLLCREFHVDAVERTATGPLAAAS